MFNSPLSEALKYYLVSTGAYSGINGFLVCNVERISLSSDPSEIHEYIDGLALEIQEEYSLPLPKMVIHLN